MSMRSAWHTDEAEESPAVIRGDVCLRVLLVEGRRGVRRPLGAVLRRGGCEVLQATPASSFDAPSLPCGDEDIDAIVIADDLFGPEVLDVLQSMRRVEWVPLVLMGTSSDERTRKQAYDLGVDAILGDTFDVADLEALLRGIAHRHRRRRALHPVHGCDPLTC
jgi:DNA-binding response OmpR family regulator